MRTDGLARAPLFAAAAIILVIALGLFVAMRAPKETATSANRAAPEAGAVFALTTNVYARPTRASDLVTIIPEGRAAIVTGSTDDGAWLRVVYPLQSTIEGWAPKTSARADSLPDLTTLPVAQTTPITSSSANGQGGPNALPDLTVSSAEVQANGQLIVRVTNAGIGAFNGKTTLTIATGEGAPLGTAAVDFTQSTLPTGRSAVIDTKVTIRQTGLVVVEVDAEKSVAESNESNNTRRVLLVGVGG